MVKRSIFFFTGCVFIVLGLIGFLLPLFPGFVPFIIGIVLVSRSSSTLRRYLSRLKTTFPRQYQKFEELRKRLFDDK